mgnify:CR=1 FL=1
MSTFAQDSPILYLFPRVNVNKENNATIIMITHDPLTASYANEVYMINDGNIRCKLNKGDSRKEFYSKIMDMLASMGGEM